MFDNYCGEVFMSARGVLNQMGYRQVYLIVDKGT